MFFKHTRLLVGMKVYVKNINRLIFLPSQIWMICQELRNTETHNKFTLDEQNQIYQRIVFL